MRSLVAACRQRPGLVVGFGLTLALLTALLVVSQQRTDGFIEGYRPVTPRATELTLVVIGSQGQRACGAVVEEPANRIEVRVSLCGIRLGSGADAGIIYLAVATLRHPVGDRVIVAGDGRVLEPVAW